MLLLLMTFDDPASISFVFRSLLMLLLLLLLPPPGRSGCWHTPLTTATVSADSAVSLFLYWVGWVSCYQSMIRPRLLCVWTELVWSRVSRRLVAVVAMVVSWSFSSVLGSKRCRKCVLSCFVITSLFLNTFFLCFCSQTKNWKNKVGDHNCITNIFFFFYFLL